MASQLFSALVGPIALALFTRGCFFLPARWRSRENACTSLVPRGRDAGSNRSTNLMAPSAAHSKVMRWIFAAAYLAPLLVVSVPANAGAIMFTNPPVLILKPSTMNGKNPAGVTYVGLAGTGGPTLQPLNNAPDKGFNFTDFEVSYTTVAADLPVGKPIPSITISWVVQRTFEFSTGMYTTTSAMNGSALVPAGGTVNSISLSTFWAAAIPPPMPTVSEVSFGPFVNNANFKNSMTTAMFPATQPDPNTLGKEILGQEGGITFTPSAVGQNFTFDFPGSAISTVAAVPEPSTLIMGATAALVVALVLKRQRLCSRKLPPGFIVACTARSRNTWAGHRAARAATTRRPQPC